MEDEVEVMLETEWPKPCDKLKLLAVQQELTTFKSRADKLAKALEEIANDELRGNGSHKRDIATAALEEYRNGK